MTPYRSVQLPAWFFPIGAALIYLTSLSAIFVHESREPSPLAIAFFAPSVLAGFVIGRFWAVALPVGVIAVSQYWVGLQGEDLQDAPVIAMVAGLLVGVAVPRLYEKALLLRHRQGQPQAAHETRAAQDAPAPRWSAPMRILRRVLSRDAVDDALDRFRFWIDTFPFGLYQPVPSLPRTRATRGAGSESRWDAMLPVLRAHGVESAVDIGACEGYFAIKLSDAGIPTIAVEKIPSNYRTALYAVRRNGARDVGVLAMDVTPENIVALPAADGVLCLSVWHHFVRSRGLAEGTEMLQAIWMHTRKVMFFDTGETEMPADYRLPPMTPDSRAWLTEYLATTCEGSRIEHLGIHRAFDPSGNAVRRNLFAVIRTTPLD
jgi:hypothetical protein